MLDTHAPPLPTAAPPRLRTSILPPIVVTAAFAALMWWLFDVPGGDIAVFAGYVVGFQIVPGCAAFVALTRPERFGLRELAIGWGLGYAVEVGFFVLTAATGTRGLFALYPVAVVLATARWTLPLLRRARLGAVPAAGGWAWGLVVLCCAAVAYLAETFFTQAPLPADAAAVSYYVDVVWNIAMSAEALHHWPLQVPSLAGEPLRYHYFADLDAAAVSQVTGLSLSTVLLRLAMVPMTILIAVQFVALARALGSVAWAGVVAGALFLLAGFADPVPVPPSRLLSTFPLSPSFLYGMVVFLPLLTLICERLAQAPGPRRLGAGWLATVVLLMAACAGGKATILPVLGGAIVLLLVIGRRWAPPRWSNRVLVAAGAATAVVFVAFGLTMYAGQTNSFEIRPFVPFGQAYPFRTLFDQLGRSAPLQVAVGPLAVVLGTLKLLAVLLPGLVALAVSRRLDGPRLLVLAVLVASLPPIYLLAHPGFSQLYFFYYGFAAASAASAVGVVELVGPAVSRALRSSAPVVTAAVVALALWLVEPPFVGDPPRAVYRALNGEVTYAQDNRNLTPSLHSGLRWVAGNTSPSAVLAVSNRWQNEARTDARYCYYTAFAERRAMVECSYDGTSRPYGALEGNPERFALNDAIFGSADRAALRTAVERYGVDYLLVDELHGGAHDDVERLGRVVFRNDALVVVDVRGA